ncbi:DUF6776 family protein [uncultured Paraglaciecola sp.]|uniref:DUF6776 family protein n=1 Tax=uncultured Paraglaciecola sp. TaxID=1765024 RepID=UPI002591A10B|nr:DUF6776 family protein [uncultured Paraglaciecola sp.]
MTLAEYKKQFGAFRVYAFLVVIISLALYLGFKLGGANQSRQASLISIHEQSIQNLTTENLKLTKDLNVLGVELEVAKLAQMRHKSEIETILDREKKLKSTLEFYQQVMAPELKEEGFFIEGFYAEPTLSENSYRFELALVQHEKTKNTLKGTLNISLVGSENGQPKEYPLKQFLPEQQALRFSFKYFQLLNGEVTLPTGFQPEKVTVHAVIYQFKRKKGELTSTFDWLSTRE